MKTLTSSLFIHLLRINVTAAFCILFLFMASAQKQYISGKGMPNFANVKNSRTVQKLQLDLSKNPGKYQHYLNAKQNLQQKKFPGANIQKFRERSEQISINISEANFNKNKKPTPAEQIDFIHKHKSDSSNIYLYFYNYCYYCWDSSCFTTDVAFLFSAYIWIDYPQDTSDITVIINFGDGADTTLNPFCYWNYFNDSLSTYECYDFIALALHAYSSPGIYTPTCTVITSTGDIVSQSYYEPITIYPGAPPSPSITYFDSYSGQYCWNGVLNDYGNYFYFELYYPFFQSFSDVFIINIDFGDGNDTMYQATIPNQIDWWWGGYFCPPYFWFDAVHKYSQAGTYTVTSTVTFPDGYTDTAASIAYIADHCVTIGGKVFIDEDGDCIPDTDEAGVSDVWLYIPYDYDSLYYDSSFYYSPCYNVYWDNWAYTDTNGDYWFSFPNICPVSNKIMFDPYYNFYPLDNLPLSCPESGYYNFSTDNPSLDYNFALGCTSGYDLQGFVWGWRFRPGFQGYMYPHYGNYRYDSISGTAKFIIDNPGFLTIDSIFPAPNAISGDTIIWNFYNISVLDWWNYTTIYITTATSAQEGDTIHTTLILEPASDDSNPDNNFITEDFIITNSWDPNEKETLPKSDTPEGFIQPDDLLTYIIHFQNSGSDTAYNIFIVDTIDANLNIGTINILTSSHYMEFYRDENIYTFSFPYIMLPDSTTNLTASQGFVSYSIKPKANLPGGTMITNTANIFFDYNPAVVTNTTINTIAHATDISPDKGNVSNGIIVYPNPAKTELFIQFREFPVNTNIVLSDLTGRQIYTHSINTSLMRISLADISQGLYFLQVQGTDKIVTFKIAVK